MPLVYQQNINSNTKLGVWHITETEKFFRQKVMLQKEITHPHKRLQHLAGRLMLKELFIDFPLELIKIADTRKPFLANESYHFSISHCGNYAAVIVSTANRVGIDIEIPQEKIERVMHKFLSDDEKEKLSKLQGLTKQECLTVGWSIKETLFKWYGAGELDFKKNMAINSFEKMNECLIANCTIDKEKKYLLKVQCIIFNGNSLTWLVT
ncbi:MAG: 4'-phosphopantetheinyl transferase superfamily protein [Ferruginibacter sp.]